MGAYTNGYDFTAVITALKDRVGFRQPVGTGVPTLTPDVTTTLGGRYFQDFHSLVTVENIKSTMEQAAASDADLITYLTNLRQAAIMRALNGVFTGPQIVEQVKLYDRYGLNDQLPENNGQFVGFEIDVANETDVAVQLDALHVYLDSAVTFNVYLFKDGIPAPVFTIPVTSVAATITELVLTDKVIGRGKYYLGYFQDDLGSAKAYQEQVKCWNRTFWFGAMLMQSASTGATTFDRSNRTYPGLPFGLNVEMSSFKDHTKQIQRKAAMFDDLIGLIMAYSVIEQIIYAVRSNAGERILKDQLDRIGLQLDLNGAAPISDSPKMKGLKQRIDQAVIDVKEAFYPKSKPQTVSLCS
jgi:hypothetical protein